jgi:hypothetical protein
VQPGELEGLARVGRSQVDVDQWYVSIPMTQSRHR